MKFFFKYLFILYFNVYFNNIIGHGSVIIGNVKTTTTPTKSSAFGSTTENGSIEGYSPDPYIIKTTSGLMKKCDPCPKGIRCVPPIQCPAHVRMKPSELPQICDLSGGSHGYCCHTGQNHTASHKKSDSDNHINGSKLARSASINDIGEINGIVNMGKAQFAKMLNDEKQHVVTVTRGQPQFTHTLLFHESPSEIRQSIDQSHRAMEQIFVSRAYQNKEHISALDFELKQVEPNLVGSGFQSTCGHHVECSQHRSKYRTADGTCNNPQPGKGSWGATGTSSEKLLPPSYDDGIWSPRSSSVDRSHLPNARTVSRSTLHDVHRPHPKLNLLFMQMGQFITHDITRSSSIRSEDGKDISCCTKEGSAPIPREEQHFACYPIAVEPHDEFYEQFKQGCMNMVRSSLAPNEECKMSYGKQMNRVTHYLDGSGIYGSTLKGHSEVRSFKGGQVRMFHDFGRELLPLTTDKDTCDTNENGPCFFAGDNRANQIISLTVLHTLFAREHNRIADILQQLNPYWDDEKLFQETRAIVVAKLQYIIYNEWLPNLIGTRSMERFHLYCKQHGYSDDYDHDVNPSVTTEFSTAAFRFGHSVVDGKFMIRKGGNLDEIISIPDVMFNPIRLRHKEFYDAMLNTMTEQPMQEFDSAVTRGLSNFLFRGSSPFGLDLAAINIQRGRDHGLRSYNDYLTVSGHHPVHDFKEFGEEAAAKLGSVYHHPDDIDLWLGGLQESSLDDGLVGPTFAEIIADQFSRLRRGDSYFHEHNPNINPGHFTEAQLHEIRRSTMARIICDNADGYALHAVAPHAFLRADLHGNEPVSCENEHEIPQLNYGLWKE